MEKKKAMEVHLEVDLMDVVPKVANQSGCCIVYPSRPHFLLY